MIRRAPTGPSALVGLVFASIIMSLALASMARAASPPARPSGHNAGRASRASSLVPQTAANGSITGKVTAAASTGAIEGIEVCAYPDSEEAQEVEELMGVCAKTDAAGEYTVPGLATGEYVVQFFAPEQSTLNYLAQYYNDQHYYFEADTVDVTDGAPTSGIDASLSEGGAVTGKVTSAASKEALEGIEVCADATTEGGEGRCVKTGASGEYTLAGLPSGQYEINFGVPLKSTLNYLGQYYNDKSSYEEASKVTVATGSTTPGIDAALLIGGQITGTVTSAGSSAAIEGIQVCANSDSDEVFAERCTTSGPGGSYTIASLPTAEYTVAFSVPYDSNLNYLFQYYGGKVSVNAGGTTAEINAALLAGGEITGKVTSAASKAAIEGIVVCASDTNGERCATSGTDGEYTLAGLPTGEYVVEFYPEYKSSLNYLEQYYSGKSSYSEATKVAVTAGDPTPGINAAMIAGGEITGKVTSATTKEGLGKIAVCATSGSDELGNDECTATNANGEYTIVRLTSGEYGVQFYSYGTNGNYLTQYYDDKAAFAEATKVAVSAGSTTSGINAALLTGGEITGTVTSATSKKPLADVEVCAISGSEEYGCATTNATGQYGLTRLGTGEYKVEFSSPAHYQTQYYNDQSSLANANTVSVTAGATTSEIDAALLAAGEISGTVKNANGEPITSEDVCVQAYLPVSGEDEEWSYSQSAVTNASGEYAITGLQAGSYKIAFADCDQSDSGYRASARDDVPQYYSGTTHWSSASLVVLSAGGVKTGIGAELAAGTSISGHAYSSSNNSVAKSAECVSAQQSPSGGPPNWVSGPLADYYEAESNSEGAYSVAHLAPSAEYVVEFSDCDFPKQYLTQFDGGVSTPEAATVLTPTVDSPATGIDAHLSVGGKIAGVVSADGSPITADDICISLSRIYEDGNPDAHPYDDYGYASSGEGGKYSIGGLSPGNYAVHFEDCDGSFSSRNDVSQYYKGASGYYSATPVEATLGGEHGGIDVELAPATSISGFVYGSPTKANPLSDVCVDAYPANEPTAEAAYDYTATDGSYTLKHLAPGEGFKVEFSDCLGGAYAIQYYDESSTFAAATVLKPTLTEPLSGINAHLVNDVPVTEITGGPANDAASSATTASFAFTSTIPGSTYACKLDAGPYTACTSPYTTGTLSSAEHTFTVRASADGNTDPAPPSVTWLVDPSSPNSTSEGSVPSGGTVSSNPGEGPSASDPVVVEARLPGAGTVTMTKEPATTPSENGYTVFGKQLDISATEPGSSTPLSGTIEDPITLTFDVAGTEIPAGTEQAAITVLRNGEPAPNCTGVQGTASPDPCVESRAPIASHGVELTVLTTHCSLWNLAAVPSTKQKEEEAAAKKKAEEEAAAKKKAEEEAAASKKKAEEEAAAKKKAEEEAAASKKKAEEEAAAKKKAEEEAANQGVLGTHQMIPAPQTLSIKIVKVKISADAVVVTIKESLPGTATITGRDLKKTLKGLGAGTHEITVPLTKAGKAARRAHKRIKLVVSLQAGSRTVVGSETIKL